MMVDTDGAPMSSGAKPIQFVAAPYEPRPDEIEKITIPPSTELIPDEYEHEDNKKGLMVIFSSKSDQGNKDMLQRALAQLDYDVSNDRLYEVSTKDGVLRTLREIAKKDHSDKTCLIVVFLANAEMDDQFLPDDEEEDSRKCISVGEVWSHFTGDKCISFRNKPKIFLFQAYKSKDTTETDGIVIAPPEGAYDIPAEADMLIVYKKVESPEFRNTFMEQLCSNFHNYGHREDIVALITHTFHADNMRPLIISTLTKKFYMTHSSKRGHYYDLHNNHDNASDILEKLLRINKPKTDHKVVKKWHDAVAGLSASDAASTKVEMPVIAGSSQYKAGPSRSIAESNSQSKRVSRTTSNASSVDTKKRLKPKAAKKKPEWKY